MLTKSLSHFKDVLNAHTSPGVVDRQFDHIFNTFLSFLS